MNEAIRKDFPATKSLTYLNSASISPTPTPVIRAAQEYFARRQEWHTIHGWLDKAEEVRQQAATMIGAKAEEVFFGMNTGDGINLVASAIDWQPGDNVVLDDLAYVSDFVLWQHYEQTYGIELRIVQNLAGAATVEAFADVTNERTRLISIPYVSHHNGYLHDIRGIADLAHAFGAYFYTDAVQAVGAIPVDVRAGDMDVLACGTYKWVFGPFGLSFVFVKEDLLDRIRPNKFGFMQKLNFEGAFRDWPGHHSAKQYEYGTYNFGGLWELGAGLQYIAAVGQERLTRHVVDLAHRLHAGLLDLGYRMFTPPGNQTPIVTCFVDASADVSDTLEDAGVTASVRLDKGQLRLSPGVFNIPDEIDTVLGLMERLRR